MKILKQLLFIAILMVGASVATFAQSNDNKKTPPKEGNPPVVRPQPKKDEDKPRNDNRGNDNRGNDNRGPRKPDRDNEE